MPSEATSQSADADGSTSSSLIDRVQARDPEAWRRLAHIYGPLVYRWTQKAGLQESDAADVSQEVFRAVASHVAEFRRDRPDATFRGWLWTITRHKIHDFFRRRTGEPAARGGSDALSALHQLPAAALEGTAAAGEQAALAQRAIALLKSDFEENTWRAFWRTAVDGLPASEVAAELRISVAAVYTAKSRVLARLRQEMAGEIFL